ncbi:MAG TPA: M23 family metallopeptidase [Clostridiales bacterium]|jgi:murein DD-endopeptidase MepM/ murein hydrolase activator NlpD|nr:M23 family metallopeptidase [Clostridiales bacterium]
METNLSNFSSYEPHRRAKYNHRNLRRSRKNSGGLMPIKIGLCVGICLVVVMVNVFLSPLMARVTQIAEEPKSTDDGVLGRLRFVELPGIIEVFAGGDRLTLPVNYQSASLDATSTELELKCAPYATVTTCAEGVVKSIGIDDRLGMYIVIRHDGDIESLYYGFSAITVEEGQPIEKLDTLGVLDENGLLVMKINHSGVPKNPCDYFPVSSVAKK